MLAKGLIAMKRPIAFLLTLFFNGTLMSMVAWPQTESDWRIYTIAGTGKPGHGGDGGPASQARLSFPTGVAADKAGNVYIADFFSQRIRRVDAIGTITTVTGIGGSGNRATVETTDRLSRRS